MLVACLGDVMLDVIVETPGALVTDDDTPAGSRSRPAARPPTSPPGWSPWAGDARVFGPRADTGPGHLVEQALTGHGVEVWGTTTGRTGAVVSLVNGGIRSMASDPGDLGWLDDVRSGAWLDGADWLFVSGYALLRTRDPRRVVETAAVARAHGTRIAVDLSSAAMVADFGADAFSDAVPRAAAGRGVRHGRRSGPRALARSAPATAPCSSSSTGAAERRSCSGTSRDQRPPSPGPVVDVTGAGDALAAGYLVGGPDLAMQAAARCIARRGAQPGTAPS